MVVGARTGVCTKTFSGADFEAPNLTLGAGQSFEMEVFAHVQYTSRSHTFPMRGVAMPRSDNIYVLRLALYSRIPQNAIAVALKICTLALQQPPWS